MLKFKTSLRYVFSKSSGNRNTSVFIIIGISLCLCCIILILSVMDALQSSQIESYRNVLTFDLTVESKILCASDIKNIRKIKKAFDYQDFDVVYSNLIKGKSAVGILRAIDSDAYSDNDFISLTDFYGLTSSSIINHSLSVSGDSEIQVTFLKKGKTKILTPYNRSFALSGTYYSHLSEFNSSYCLIPYTIVGELLHEEKKQIGIFADDSDLNGIKTEIYKLDSNAVIRDWKQNNSTLYSALKLEKSVVFIFLIFVFCIVLLSLKNSTDRLIRMKLREAGILRSMGMTANDVTEVFFLYGFIITVSGLFIGVIISFLSVSFLNHSSVLLPQIHLKFKSLSVLIFSLMIVSFLFVFSSIRKYMKNDVMEVILNASY